MGLLGLLVNSINYLSLSGSVGVGTSTYVALGLLYWIAGMVLFGVGALIAKAPARLSEPFIYAAPPVVQTSAPPLQSIVTPPPRAAAATGTQPKFDLPLKIAATVVGIVAVIFVVTATRTNAPGEKAVPQQVAARRSYAPLTEREQKITFGQMRLQVCAALSFLAPTIDAAI